MISRLSGRLVDCNVTSIVVDVGGVGYEVTVPVSTYERLPAQGEPVSLHTHLVMREESLALYGFATQPERALFLLLITVSGIGPRIALSVLSCMSIGAFRDAVLQGDLKAMTRISGIGKRTAERMVVDLRDRIAQVVPTDGATGLGSDRDACSREAQDAVAALTTLGFKADAARKAVQTVCDRAGPGSATVENLIRKALTVLNSQA